MFVILDWHESDFVVLGSVSGAAQLLGLQAWVSSTFEQLRLVCRDDIPEGTLLLWARQL
jgi:hypothetical protein